MNLVPPGAKTLCSPLRSSKHVRVFSPLELNERVNNPPRGQSSPLGANFTPRGKLHPWAPTHVVKNWLQVHLSMYQPGV
jgi:hypothetical protein